MARRKQSRARAKQLRAREAQSPARPQEPPARPKESRLAPARRRAALAKAVLAVGSACVFVTAAALARVAYPGHAKKPARSLAPPKHFVDVVRKNALEAGMLGPITAPPQVVSSPS
jgi:hypothetical protein